MREPDLIGDNGIRYRFERLPVMDESQYILDWRSPTYKKIGEHMVIQPRMPSKNKILNYDKKIDRQKWEYVDIPAGLKRSKKIFTVEEDAFIRREWHRRYHGVWIMIKGEPIWVSGRAYHFFNYWHTEKNMKPWFRWEALEFYWLWEDIYHDIDCFGLEDIKCRRLGDTEKLLHIMYEEATRYRYTIGGMQNTDRPSAKKNYLRLMNGHKRMIWYFRPVSRGTTNPQTKLELLYPDQKLTRKTLEAGRDLYEEEYDVPSVGSEIDYEATVVLAYDGTLKHIYHMDEPGKISPSVMDVETQWGVIRRCMSEANDTIIVGKGALSTTVEDVDDGRTVEKMQRMWDKASPLKKVGAKEIDGKMVGGQTINGLRRIFRDFTLAADWDEFGHHKREEATRMRDEMVQALLEIGDMAGLIEFQRKHPASIDEALQIAGIDCTINPHLLDYQLMQIRDNPGMLDGVRRGELVWVNGKFGGEVEFIEDPRGDYLFTQFPNRKNYKQFDQSGSLAPGNSDLFSIGCDPIDSRAPTGSDAAIVVYRKFNLADESDEVEYDDDLNVLNPEKMVTDQFVSCYNGRPDNPYDVYVAALKMAMFWGAPIFFERNKPYVMNTMIDNGYRKWVQRRPKETVKGLRQKGKDMGDGADATLEIISLYVDALKAHTAGRIKTYKLLPLLKDMRKFNTKNRTERDLSVAAGFALLGGMDSRMKRKVQEIQTQWDDVPWQTY